MLTIESAGVTDIGKKREGNEDALLVDDTMGLYVVSDGMGGHLAGEVASGIVVDTLARHMARGPGGREAEGRPGAPPMDASLSGDANRLLAGIYEANGNVHRTSQEKASCRGMGATVSAVYFTGDTCIVCNVGDSPVYLVHDGRTELVSVIHNVMAEQQRLFGKGRIPAGGIFKHMLTRAIGTKPHVSADTCEIPCFPGDRIVICSDGLSDKVSPKEIGEVASAHPPPEAARRLVETANRRGGDDNITVIVLKFGNNFFFKKLSKGIARGVKRLFTQAPAAPPGESTHK